MQMPSPDTHLWSRIARTRRARQSQLGAAARADVARGRPARGNRAHRFQCDGGRGAQPRARIAGKRRSGRRLDPRVGAGGTGRGARASLPRRRARLGAVRRRARGALLGWTSVCDLADLRTDPGASRSRSAARARERSTGSTASTCRPRRRRAPARRLALRRRQGAGLDRRRRCRDPGRAAALREARAARAPAGARSRAPRSAMRSTSWPAGTSSYARCRARPRACAAPTDGASSALERDRVAERARRRSR